MEEEIITEKTVSPVFQRAINARGWVDYRAYEIQQELARVCFYSLLGKTRAYVTDPA